MSLSENTPSAVVLNERDHVRGPADASVTLVQYGDFECPYCGDLYPIIRRIHNRLASHLQVVFRHFPLTDQHPHAQLAAEAAEAAAAQSEANFWQMHDMLYEHQGRLNQEALQSYAEELNLDTAQFAHALENGTYTERVRADSLQALDEGVSGTPTFFINGELYRGPFEFDDILAAVVEAGQLNDVVSPVSPENRQLREAIDRSQRGAPAAGRAVRDLFSADEIFQRVTASADEEIDRGGRELFFSGLAAGLSLASSFFGRAVMTAAYPNDPIGLGNLLYPIGFIIIVLGGYQLYTENTLTPVTLVLTRLASIPSLLRLWGIVLIANIIGAIIPAYIFANTAILEPEVAEAALYFGEHALGYSWGTLFFKAIIAGGLVATMVWLVHAARDTITRFFVVYLIMFLIPAGELFHCVVGAFEMLYLIFSGATTVATAFGSFFLPVVLGNTLGGVVFVAFIAYSMTEERYFPDRDERRSELSITEWLFGQRIHQALNQNEALD